jgi:hypothetical protein
MKRLKMILSSLAFIGAWPGWSLAQGAEPSTPPTSDPSGLLTSLKSGHPRLLADAGKWRALNEQRKTDRELDRFLRWLEDQGRALLEEPPLRHEKQGIRLLLVSRTALTRIVLWSFNYRLTGDERFLRRAQQEMLAAAAFADWNPSHFLDTAEMTAALAIGYDWLFEKLDPDSRATIRAAIVTKGLRELIEPTKPSHVWWQRSEMNWNQVCFGGLTLGALAVADEEPEIAGQVLARAKANNPHGQKSYAPEGVYPEGPSYWSYGTTYEVMMIAALESALGTDWDLTATPGFTGSTGFLLQTTGPSGRVFNYSDGSENTEFEPALYWFAQRLKDPSLLAFQFEKLRTWMEKPMAASSGSQTLRFLPLTAFWWHPSTVTKNPRPPMRWLGRGEQPLAVFRTSWNDPDAMYLALKGGSASLSHAHMDAGSFVFEAKGVRWARDLGAQDYHSLESKGIKLFDMKQQSDRWKVFRTNNRSHNVLTINHQLHRVDGSARITGFSDDEQQPCAVLDLTPIFAGQATKVARGFLFRPDKHMLVRDELEGLKPGDTVRWAMVTGAEITVDGPIATLARDGKTLHARLIAPAGAKFESLPADPPPDDFNAPNPGMRMLIVNATAPDSGRLNIDVQLSLSADPSDEPFATVALERWPVK